MIFWLIKVGFIIFVIQMTIGAILFNYHKAFTKRTAKKSKLSFRILYKELRSHSTNASILIADLKEELKERFDSKNSKFLVIFNDYFTVLEDSKQTRTIVGLVLDDKNAFKDKEEEKEFVRKHNLRTATVGKVSQYALKPSLKLGSATTSTEAP